MSDHQMGPSVPESDRRRFDLLIRNIWDEELDHHGAAELSELLAEHPALRAEYLEAKLSLSELVELSKSWLPRGYTNSVDGGEFRAPARAPVADRVIAERHADAKRLTFGSLIRVRWGHAAALAAVMLVLFLGWRALDDESADQRSAALSPPEGSDDVVAKVVDAVSSEMADLLPSGSAVTVSAGQVLEIEAGLTELRFRCGATAVLAGPARLTVLGQKAVALDSGRIKVHMDPGVTGFEVLTPDGKITDLGTAFGVRVEGGTQALVSVYDGEVELDANDDSGPAQRLTAGQAAWLDPVSSLSRVASDGDLGHLEGVSLRRPDSVVEAFMDAHVRGPDDKGNYFQENYGRETELLVKYDSASPPGNRRTWIAFDLSGIPRDELLGARLRLAVSPNQLAEEFRASKDKPYRESDTTWAFEVFGLWDEFHADWSENEITWDNAPGNASAAYSGRFSGPRAPVRLGGFSIHRGGEYGEVVAIADSALLQFLKADEDGRVSLVLTRRTPCLYNSGEDVVVHGFASREHPELSPPTLELWGDFGGDRAYAE